jgi:hypothetical protein
VNVCEIFPIAQLSHFSLIRWESHVTAQYRECECIGSGARPIGDEEDAIILTGVLQYFYEPEE